MNQRYRLAHSREIKKNRWNNVCPSCGQHKFSPYIDTVTNQPIAAKECGRCCRERSCAYHMTPSQWFKDNPPEKREWLPREQYAELMRQRRKEAAQIRKQPANSPSVYRGSTAEPGGRSKRSAEQDETTRSACNAPALTGTPSINRGGVNNYLSHMSTLCTQTRSDKNHLARWLCTLFPENRVAEVLARYRTGSTRDGRIIYWQIDERGQVRAGKVMAYNPDGHRRKEKTPSVLQTSPPLWGEGPPVCWVHSMKINGIRFDEMLAPQCLFGLSLLNTEHMVSTTDFTDYSDYSADSNSTRQGKNPYHLGNPWSERIGVVESEKTALILSLLCPDKVWLATGGKQNFKEQMLTPLLGYEVEVYPDADALADWYARAVEMNRTIGTHLHIPTWYYDLMNHDKARRAGWDLADVLLR